MKKKNLIEPLMKNQNYLFIIFCIALIAMCTGGTSDVEITVKSIHTSSTLDSEDNRYTADNLIDGTQERYYIDSSYKNEYEYDSPAGD
jgi:hypothetical protein